MECSRLRKWLWNLVSRYYERTLASCMSLSMPRGPRVVRTTSATATQALMLLISWGFPWLVSVPSFRRMICGCCKVEMMKGFLVWLVEQKRSGCRILGLKDESLTGFKRQKSSINWTHMILTMPKGNAILSAAPICYAWINDQVCRLKSLTRRTKGKERLRRAQNGILYDGDVLIKSCWFSAPRTEKATSEDWDKNYFESF